VLEGESWMVSVGSLWRSGSFEMVERRKSQRLVILRLLRDVFLLLSLGRLGDACASTAGSSVPPIAVVSDEFLGRTSP